MRYVLQRTVLMSMYLHGAVLQNLLDYESTIKGTEIAQDVRLVQQLKMTL